MLSPNKEYHNGAAVPGCITRAPQSPHEYFKVPKHTVPSLERESEIGDTRNVSERNKKKASYVASNRHHIHHRNLRTKLYQNPEFDGI